MKKIVLMLVMLSLIFTVGCQAKKGSFTDGTYTGEGEGKYGPIKVEVLVEKGNINTINILEHNETPGLSDPILEQIPASIIKEQSTEVDAISGATITSNAIITAVKNALTSAQ